MALEWLSSAFEYVDKDDGYAKGTGIVCGHQPATHVPSFTRTTSLAYALQLVTQSPCSYI